MHLRRLVIAMVLMAVFHAGCTSDTLPVSTTPPCDTHYGYDQVGSSTSGYAANTLYAVPVTVSFQTQVKYLSMHLNAYSSGQFGVALYTNDGPTLSQPQSVMTGFPINSPMGNTWNNLTLASLPMPVTLDLPAGIYWLVLYSDSVLNVDLDSGTSIPLYYAGRTYDGTFPVTMPGGTSTTSSRPSFYLGTCP